MARLDGHPNIYLSSEGNVVFYIVVVIMNPICNIVTDEQRGKKWRGDRGR